MHDLGLGDKTVIDGHSSSRVAHLYSPQFYAKEDI